ncbi:MAG: ketoacyl-ACP synthase III [Oscillospiraceae bacterium]|nr:ketoacyl-ACP synthase III [Oscillospiraceae bacterium]
MNAYIAGTGSYFPPGLLTNQMLENMVDTSDEWIYQRTGIRTRHIAGDMSVLDLAEQAAKNALEQAGHPNCDMIAVSTCTPDMFYPSVACRLGARLGIDNAFCFDLSGACTGFIQAIEVAGNAIQTGSAKTALVVAAEKLSSGVDYTDRNTCILFGDAAGAFVMSGGGSEHVKASYMASRNQDWACLYADIGGHMVMNGRDVYKFAVDVMPEAMGKVLERAGKTIEQVRWIIPHQANIRIIKAAAQRFNLPDEKLVVTLDKTGNTSSATIPCIVDEMHREGKLQPGDLILLVAFGAGLTYGAVLYEW